MTIKEVLNKVRFQFIHVQQRLAAKEVWIAVRLSRSATVLGKKEYMEILFCAECGNC